MACSSDLGLDTLLRLAALVVCVLAACDGPPTGPAPPTAVLRVSPIPVQLGISRQGELELANVGTRALGPVTFFDAAIAGPGGASVPTGRIHFDPAELPTLNPGSAVTVALTVDLPGLLPPGTYSSTIRVRSDLGDELLPLTFVVEEVPAGDVATLTFIDPPSQGLQGEPLELRVSPRDEEGRHLQGAPVVWSTVPADAAFLDRDEEWLVPYEPGPLQVIASAGSVPDAPADTAFLDVVAREVSGSITVRTSVRPPRNTSDLWVHGDHAYTGSWSQALGAPPGNAVFAWDVSNPADPVLVDSVLVDARVVNDVKVSTDGTLGVLTHEFSEDLRNGVTFLDLADPAHPEVIGRYTAGLQAGVHNVWIEGDYVYLVVDGNGNGLRVLDVSDPSAPVLVASYAASGSTFLHDVYVRDGLAFLSHWDAGLVILDVGNGIAGGSPTDPVEVSRVSDLGGRTHNAWYWPEAGYVFVGEENFQKPGIMHVVDARDLRRPREVATYRVPGDTPHNFWLDEENAILYMAWYGNGIRALDVSGDLLGELERQGREIAGLVYAGTGSCPPLGTCTWAPQLHDGTLFLSDIEEGLVVATPIR